MQTKTKCPACGMTSTPTDQHLLREYKAIVKAGFDQMFGHNARKCCNEIVDLLADRGITEYHTIFGKSELRKWTY